MMQERLHSIAQQIYIFLITLMAVNMKTISTKLLISSWHLIKKLIKIIVLLVGLGKF